MFLFWSETLLCNVPLIHPMTNQLERINDTFRLPGKYFSNPFSFFTKKKLTHLFIGVYAPKQYWAMLDLLSWLLEKLVWRHWLISILFSTRGANSWEDIEDNMMLNLLLYGKFLVGWLFHSIHYWQKNVTMMSLNGLFIRWIDWMMILTLKVSLRQSFISLYLFIAHLMTKADQACSFFRINSHCL